METNFSTGWGEAIEQLEWQKSWIRRLLNASVAERTQPKGNFHGDQVTVNSLSSLVLLL